MIRDDAAFQLLYVRRLAPGSNFEVVKQVVAISRLRNPERGVSGVLLFDGERFGQLIEGGEAAVRALMNSIERDPRHVGIRTLLCGRSANSSPPIRAWVSDYCDVNLLEALDRDGALTGPAALAAFNALLPYADLE